MRRVHEGGSRKLDLDDLEPERRHDVAVGRIPGRCDGYAVARIEHRQEGEVERSRGTGGHRNAVGRYVDAVVIGIVAGNRPPQRDETERIRVANAPLGQRFRRRIADVSRRGIGRLTDGHRDDRLAERLQTIGLREDVHGVERLDIAAFRDRYRHCITRVPWPTAPHKCPIGVGITSS